MIKLYKKIANCYRRSDFKGVIANFEKYCDEAHFGVTPKLISYYATALAIEKRTNEAIIMSRIYEDFNQNTVVTTDEVIEDLRAYQYETAKKKLKEVIKKLPYYDSAYYYLGTIALEEGYHDEAIMYLDKVVEINNNPQLVINSKNLINKILMMKKHDKVFRLRYKVFKEANLKLEKGYIVRINAKDNLSNLGRLYFIYDVIGENIYALPLRNNINDKYYIINGIYDCSVQTIPVPVVIKENQIELIDGVLKKDEADLVIKDAYRRYSDIKHGHNLETKLEKAYIKTLKRIDI